MYQKYLLYEIIDFLADEDFKKWIIEEKTDEALSRHWEEVAGYVPEKRAAMLAAEEQIKRMARSDTRGIEPDRKEVWRGISDVIQQDLTIGGAGKAFAYTKYGYWLAASLFLLLSAAGTVFWYSRAQAWEEVASENGKIRKVVLPDSSEVYLGANSAVRYARRWKQDRVREVWLRGNGFFNVKHLNRDTSGIADYHRFVLHAADNLDIEVLGTSFEVKSGDNSVEVDLKSGAVKLTAGRDSRRMSPGERVVFSPGKPFVLQEGSAPLSLDWEAREMYVHNLPLAEVVSRISQLFDVKIVILDPQLLSRRLEGSIPCDNAESAVMALRDILGLTVNKEGEVIYLR